MYKRIAATFLSRKDDEIRLPWTWYLNVENDWTVYEDPKEIVFRPSKPKPLPCFVRRTPEREEPELTREEKLDQQRMTIINIYKTNGDKPKNKKQRVNYKLADKILNAKPIVSSFR